MHPKSLLDGINHDLAGQVYQSPNHRQIQTRINCLVDCYITDKQLNDRLQDLPIQFENPQPRLWKPIDWQAIDRDQIIGVELAVFLSILAGTIDTEAPIRGYTQTSRQYLDKMYPQMAHFVGGKVNQAGSMIELGLWEKEERQHALISIVRTLAQAMAQKLTDRTAQGSLIHTLRRMKQVLNWTAWSPTNKTTFLFTFDRVMRQLWRWNASLTPNYLKDLFGEQPLQALSCKQIRIGD